MSKRTTSKRITIQLTGSEDDKQHVRLQDFVDQLETVMRALRETERAVSGEDVSVLDYQVVDLRHASPFTVVVEPISSNGKLPTPTFIPEVVGSFTRELQLIKRKGELLIEPDIQRLQAYQDIGVTKKNRIAKVMIKSGGSSITIDDKFKRRLEKIVGPDQFAEGTISGMLEAVNFHNKNKFTLYPPLGPKRVSGMFPVSLRPLVKEAIGNFVTIIGTLRYKLWSPYPHGVVAEDIDIHEPESELPTLSELRGTFGRSTGNLNSAEFIDNMRHEDW